MELHWLVLLLGPVIYDLIVVNAGRQRATRRREQLLFPPATLVRFLWVTVSTLWIGVILVGIYDYADASFRLYTATALVLLVVTFLGRPRTITVDRNGLSQRGMAGFMKIRLCWEEIETAIEYKRDGLLVLADGRDRKIQHTRLHAGKEEFRSSVSRHVRLLDA